MIMTNKEKIDKIKNIIKENTIISYDIFEKIMIVFCEEILGCNISEFIPRKRESFTDGFEYEHCTPHSILIRWGNSMNTDNALATLSNDICQDRYDYEWGIFICRKGIWLLNRDVKISDSGTFFGSKRTVFKISFSNRTDIDYLNFFKRDYLIGRNKDIYFFRDLITYKNTCFPSNKSNSWDAYWSCNKRFFAYYVLKAGGRYSDNSKKSYESIPLGVYEGYIRKNGTIKTANTAKNQFFYIKSFIMSQAYNKYFDIGSDVIIRRCNDILIERDKRKENTDIEKIAGIIHYIENQRNGVRNKAIFLIILCFGLERRKICQLMWNDISEDCTRIKIGGKYIKMPHILQNSIKELKTLKIINAKYVFGNSRTQWAVPLPECGINGVLECIRNIAPSDDFYNNFSPSNIRKWLFRFLLDNKFALQDILVMMNIPIANISNFINDDELRNYTTDVFQDGKVYLLDEFMNEVESMVTKSYHKSTEYLQLMR